MTQKSLCDLNIIYEIFRNTNNTIYRIGSKIDIYTVDSNNNHQNNRFFPKIFDTNQGNSYNSVFRDKVFLADSGRSCQIWQMKASVQKYNKLDKSKNLYLYQFFVFLYFFLFLHNYFCPLNFK